MDVNEIGSESDDGSSCVCELGDVSGDMNGDVNDSVDEDVSEPESESDNEPIDENMNDSDTELALELDTTFPPDPELDPITTLLNNPTFNSFYNSCMNENISVMSASKTINDFISKLSISHPFLKDYQYLIYQYFLSEHFSDKQMLILWMTVGSGKTLLSLSCGMAGLNTKMFDRVVILSPKAIQDEFRKNLFLYCLLSNPVNTPLDRINGMYKFWLQHFIFIAYNSWRAAQDFRSIKELERSLFIIDEAHLFSKAVMKVNLLHSDLSKSKHKNRGNSKRIYDTIKSVKNKKVLALTGTPSSKMPFEMIPLFNLAYRKNLFTTNMNDWNEYYIDKPHCTIKHRDELVKLIDGLIAYVPRPIDKTSVRASKLKIVDVEMSYEQYEQYIVDYKKELDELGNSPFTNMYGFKFGKISSYHTKTFEDCIYWNKHLTNEPGEDREIGNSHPVNEIHCPKIIRMFKDTRHVKGTCVFYFRYTGIYGIKSMCKLLEMNGYKRTKANKDIYSEGRGKRFAVFSGDYSMKCRNTWKDWFNDPRNKHGDYIKYLLLSPSGSVGITLKNVRYLGIGNVDFSYATIRQILGRCNRLGSHDDLPREERTLENYMYIMTKNMQYYRQHTKEVQKICSREAPGVSEVAPSIERIIYADSLSDDMINEEFKNKVLIPASVTEKVYKKFGKGK